MQEERQELAGVRAALQGRTWESLVENRLAMDQQFVLAAAAWATLAQPADQGTSKTLRFSRGHWVDWDLKHEVWEEQPRATQSSWTCVEQGLHESPAEVSAPDDLVSFWSFVALQFIWVSKGLPQDEKTRPADKAK